MAKPRKSVRHITIRLFPPGATVKKKHKMVNLGGEGTKQSVYNTAKVLHSSSLHFLKEIIYWGFKF